MEAKKIFLLVEPHVEIYLRKMYKTPVGDLEFPKGSSALNVLKLLLSRTKTTTPYNENISRCTNKIGIVVNANDRRLYGTTMNSDKCWYFNRTIHSLILEHAKSYIDSVVSMGIRNKNMAVKEYIQEWQYESRVTYDSLIKILQRNEKKVSTIVLR